MMSSQRLRRKEVEKPLQSARCSCVWKEFSNVLENMKVGHFGHLNLLAEAAPTQIDDAKKEKPPMACTRHKSACRQPSFSLHQKCAAGCRSLSQLTSGQRRTTAETGRQPVVSHRRRQTTVRTHNHMGTERELIPHCSHRRQETMARSKITC
ncbi:uncharacterized protein LOC144072767 isoform X1 [Stigmatopora argus]